MIIVSIPKNTLSFIFKFGFGFGFAFGFGGWVSQDFMIGFDIVLINRFLPL
jgi:hypothetical protein